MGRHGDWDGTVTGVTAHGSEEGGEPCALGARCYERDYAGNPQRGPRAFCESDRRWVERAIASLPEDYVGLSFLLARSQQREERVSGSKEPPLPLAADIDAFMREIHHVALSWEIEVRETAHLSSPLEDEDDEGNRRRRMGVELSDACKTLRIQADTLLALSPREMTRHATPGRIRDLLNYLEHAEEELGETPAEGAWVRWDTSGDAWEYVTMDGTQAALELLGLHGRARGLLGLTPQRRRITEVRCDGCQGKATLVQREGPNGGWLPVVSCTMCPNVYTGARYDLLMGRIYQAQMAALETAGHTRRGERATV